MPRPRKRQSEEDAIAVDDGLAPPDLVAQVKALSPVARAKLFAVVEEIPPRFTPDGKPNIEHYLFRLHRLQRVAEERGIAGESLPNQKALVDSIMKEASLAGFTDEALADSRPEVEKYRDITRELCQNAKALWWANDEQLRTILRENATLANLAQDVHDEYRGSTKLEDSMVEMGEWTREGDPPDEETAAKMICVLVRRVLRAQHEAREPVPTRAHIPKVDWWKWRATHLLRFALYTGRSDTTESTRGSNATDQPEDQLFNFDVPHVKMAYTTWLAEDGWTVYGYKLKKVKPRAGVIIIAPPGHGKSELAIAWAARYLCRNPREQIGYIHDAEDEAIKKVGKIADRFRDDTDVGRRQRALYPHARIDKRTSTMTGLRLGGFDKTADAQVWSAGVMSAGLSRNATALILDDVVNPTDAIQSAQRERRKDILSSTWLTRRRGVNHFTFVIANAWHIDDAVMRMKANAKQTNMNTLVLKVGGPNTSPPFFSIWKAVMPPAELKKRFAGMDRNFRLWSAAYMADPQPEELRIVRRLRYYDPNGADMGDFLKSAIFGISLDPAATNREDSDYVGIVYYAIGPVAYTDKEGTEHVEPRLRFIEAMQVHATQSELVEQTRNICLQRRVDRIHVEAVGGYHATAEMLEAMVGADYIIAHQPGKRSKEIRLRQAAPAIDDAAAAFAGHRATVEFPGMWSEEGKLVGDDSRWGSWYRQILQFGTETNDHLLDATTQVVNHAVEKQEISVVGGLVSAAIKARVLQEPSRVMLHVRNMLAERRADDDGQPEEAQGWMDQHAMYADRTVPGNPW